MNILQNIAHYSKFSRYNNLHNLRLMTNIKYNPTAKIKQNNPTQEKITPETSLSKKIHNQEKEFQEKKIFLEKNKKINEYIKKIEMHESHSSSPYVITL